MINIVAPGLICRTPHGNLLQGLIKTKEWSFKLQNWMPVLILGATCKAQRVVWHCRPFYTLFENITQSIKYFFPNCRWDEGGLSHSSVTFQVHASILCKWSSTFAYGRVVFVGLFVFFAPASLMTQYCCSIVGRTEFWMIHAAHH